MLMIEPPPRMVIAGAAARIPSTTDVAFTRWTRSHSATLRSLSDATRMMPALLTRMSSPPSRASMSETTPGEPLRHDICVLETRVDSLPQERDDGGGERCPERPGLERADVSILEPSEGLGGKVVVAARLRRGQPFAEARERESMVAYGADVVLRLPETRPLDARARVEGIDDPPPEDVPRDRRRRDEEIPRDPWLRRLE